jgi:hypothetical protein
MEWIKLKRSTYLQTFELSRLRKFHVEKTKVSNVISRELVSSKHYLKGFDPWGDVPTWHDN